jgi:lactoylglutathione lyase
VTTTAPKDAISSVGIGVSDLERSIDFYTRIMGMTFVTTYKTEAMDEALLRFPAGGAAVVLMHYTDGSEHNYRDNPVKLVVHVVDPAVTVEAIRAEGLEIVREPAPIPELGNLVVGLAKDPDGYVVELLKASAPEA